MRSLIIALLVLLTACAPVTKQIKVDTAAQNAEEKLQREAALQVRMRDIERLYRVADNIVEKAAAFCDDKVKYSLGAHVLTQDAFGENMRDAARKLYGADERLRIFNLRAGTPLQTAGAQNGDAILAINDIEMPKGKDAERDFGKKMAELLVKGQPVKVKLQRGDQTLEVSATPLPVCDYPVVLVQQDAVNAYADGKLVAVTKGMLRFTQSDTELAIVIAHELAHNVMGHMDKKMTNSMLGSIFDILLAAKGVNTQGMFGGMAGQAYSQEFEAEADYVGLYMAAVAGYPIEEAQPFWRRMAAEYPASISASHSASHPSTPYRFSAMEKATQEIREKQANGRELKPDKK